MLARYVPVVVMVALAAVIATAMVVMSAVLGPRKPSPHKQEPYECGMTPVGSARERFPVRFYLIAMLFIIFDIETVFLYPWAVTFRSSEQSVKLFILAEMALFVAILFVGYFYLLGKGALNWDDPEDAASTAGDVVYRPRKPIRFGNEESGPVALPGLAQRVRGHGA